MVVARTSAKWALREREIKKFRIEMIETRIKTIRESKNYTREQKSRIIADLQKWLAVLTRAEN